MNTRTYRSKDNKQWHRNVEVERHVIANIDQEEQYDNAQIEAENMIALNFNSRIMLT